MKGAHPNVNPFAILVIAIGAALCGCRSQPGMAVNPFLAPDRVPPPATRALLPGQAQPYYPGDPLPVMQSATSPQAHAPTITGVAWNPPAGNQPMTSTKNNTNALAFSNEPTVAIPADTSSLRFPGSQPSNNATTNAIATTASGSAPSQRPGQQTVVPAAYYEVAGSEASFEPQITSRGSVPPVTSPWRPPQVTVPALTTNIPMNVPQDAIAEPPGNDIAVRLRAVPSPAPPTSTPRIRLPGYASVQSTLGAPAYGTIVQPAFGGVLQTAQAVSIPPNAFNTGTNLAALPPTATSGDGFRPRGSMR